jgi:hypothetical protein
MSIAYSGTMTIRIGPCLGGALVLVLTASASAYTQRRPTGMRPHGDRPVMIGTGIEGSRKIPTHFSGWGSPHQAITIDGRTGRPMSISYSDMMRLLRR